MTGTGSTTDYDLLTAPLIKAVKCFFVNGCRTSSNASGTINNYSAYSGDIAQVASNKGADNSIGYMKLIYSVGDTGQAWFNALFTTGITSNITSRASCVKATKVYYDDLKTLNIFGACNEPQTTVNWGLDSWVITYPAQPLVND